jgi:glycerophosphoryl diester phosphodiesterase
VSLNGSAVAENTIESFVAAAAEGAEMIELDVQHSADGVLVVIHDDTLEGTTDGSGCVRDLSLAELQMLDAGVGTAAEGSGVVIPTFAEALEAVTLDLNVEIKINEAGGCPDSDKAKLAADLVAALQADAAGRRFVVSSFDAEVLSEVEKLAPEIDTGLLSLSPDDLAVVEQRGFDELHLATLTINQEIVDAVHERGLSITVWTENNATRMETIIGYGVDVIITDEPALLAQTIASVCASQPPCSDTAESSEGCAVVDPAPPSPWRLPAWMLLCIALVGRWRRSQRRAGRAPVSQA